MITDEDNGWSNHNGESPGLAELHYKGGYSVQKGFDVTMFDVLDPTGKYMGQRSTLARAKKYVEELLASKTKAKPHKAKPSASKSELAKRRQEVKEHAARQEAKLAALERHGWYIRNAMRTRIAQLDEQIAAAEKTQAEFALRDPKEEVHPMTLSAHRSLDSMLSQARQVRKEYQEAFDGLVAAGVVTKN